MKSWRLRLDAVMVTVALGLTECTSGPGGSSPPASDPSQPARIGAPFAPADSLDPVTAISPGSVLLAFNVYDSLAVITKKGVMLSLVKSIEPNATTDGWTVALRDGFTCSDGTATTGQDVLGSLSHLAQSPSYAALYSSIDFEAPSTSGSTATLKLKKPASDFFESSLGMFSAITPKGKLTGTSAGLFIADKGDPGIGYQLYVNDKYWDDTPSILQVAMTPTPDSTAQANALRTGEIDLVISFSSAALTTLSEAPNVEIADATLESASVLELALNTRVAPFNDSEVRRTAKLAVDRDELVSTVLGSIGEAANDMFGKGYDSYPEDVARTMVNREEAKCILVEKGITSFTIVTADVTSDTVSSAESMIQEFAGVGVQVTVDKRGPQTYYGNLKELHQAQMAVAFWVNHSSITEFHSQVIPNYPLNLSDFTSETIQQNLAKATATLDAAGQKKLMGEVNRETHGQGGDLIWDYQKQVSVYRAGLENFASVQLIPWLTEATFNPIG